MKGFRFFIIFFLLMILIENPSLMIFIIPLILLSGFFMPRRQNQRSNTTINRNRRSQPEPVIVRDRTLFESENMQEFYDYYKILQKRYFNLERQSNVELDEINMNALKEDLVEKEEYYVETLKFLDTYKKIELELRYIDNQPLLNSREQDRIEELLKQRDKMQFIYKRVKDNLLKNKEIVEDLENKVSQKEQKEAYVKNIETKEEKERVELINKLDELNKKFQNTKNEILSLIDKKLDSKELTYIKYKSLIDQFEKSFVGEKEILEKNLEDISIKGKIQLEIDEITKDGIEGYDEQKIKFLQERMDVVNNKISKIKLNLQKKEEALYKLEELELKLKFAEFDLDDDIDKDVDLLKTQIDSAIELTDKYIDEEETKVTLNN